ncbi:hypothetical protein [Paenibacillus montanisoli]|uniref:Uncharacterized protein n=1 Tax=Paenibacillus montanisoli TaxID=2081970 RepID=A0A328TVL8_9BACL|nr:hypothetical protein [Paenibacillus montanisoli]RAP74558.1 hypothetical protein DL346_21075 [Paenibacillus montanisoli]
MAYSLSASLLYGAKYRGYCYANKTYALSLLYMTDDEKKILKYLAYRMKLFMRETVHNRFHDIALR